MNEQAERRPRDDQPEPYAEADGGIIDVSNKLDMTLRGMSELTDELRKRLGPVLRQDAHDRESNVTTASPKPVPRTPLVGHLQDMQSVAESRLYEIRAIIDAIDL